MKRFKRLALIVLPLLFLVLSAFSFSPAHARVQAHTYLPATNSSCYGDGLPNWNPPYAACDNFRAPNSGQFGANCGNDRVVENSKAIGSSYDGQIGVLYLWHSSNTIQNGQPTGCNSWWAQVQITAPGTYYIEAVEIIEANDGIGCTVDCSEERETPGNVSQNNSGYSFMVGDYQPGGCYHAISGVDDLHGVQQQTITNTYCF